MPGSPQAGAPSAEGPAVEARQAVLALVAGVPVVEVEDPAVEGFADRTICSRPDNRARLWT